MTRSEWVLVALLIASIFINYIDRGNLSIAAPVIEQELKLSPLQMGSLLSSFFWTYALLQLFGLPGWLADRYPVKTVFAGGFLLWSTATIVTGLVSGFVSIYVARLVLGAGESLAYPCYSRIFASDLPQHHRGRANALLDAGSKLGPAVGTYLGGLLLVRLGWRLFFIVLGVASLTWLIPWLAWSPRTRADAHPRTHTERAPSVGRMLRLRAAWGCFAGHFCGNYFWFFLLTWIPSYLVRERNFGIGKMANLVSIAFVAVASATVAVGWISDRFIARGVAVTTVRKAVVVIGLAGSSVILPVAFANSATISICFLMLACMSFGAYTSNHWAITQTLAGPLMAGRWTSLQNGFGSMAGIIAPLLAGWIANETGSSKTAFVISSCIALAGACFWGLMVERVEEVNWERNSDER